MRLFGPKFKPGDRVVYQGIRKQYHGDLGTVRPDGAGVWDEEDKQWVYKVAYDDGVQSRSYQSSIRHYIMTPFEADLRAYIAAEKLALGIS